MSAPPTWACRACGSDAPPARSLDVPMPGGGARARYGLCARCGTATLASSARVDEHYDAAYYGEGEEKFHSFIERLRDKTYLGRARWVSRATGLSAGSILDIGCGDGRFLGAMAAAGWHIAGTELPGPAFERARRVAGIDLRPACDAILEPPGAGPVDAITLWHVLEHLPDPRATLARCADLLRPGGWLIIEVPNFSSLQAAATGGGWMHLDPPRHLVQFSEPGLRLLLKDAGFVPGTTETSSLMMGALGWIQSLLNAFLRPRETLYRSLHAGGTSRLPALPLTASWLAMVALLAPSVALSFVECALRRGPVLRVISRRA